MHAAPTLRAHAHRRSHHAHHLCDKMSRAHMIYDDRPLAQEGVKTSRWQGKWDPQTLSSRYICRSWPLNPAFLTSYVVTQRNWHSYGGSVPQDSQTHSPGLHWSEGTCVIHVPTPATYIIITADVTMGRYFVCLVSASVPGVPRGVHQWVSEEVRQSWARD